jgi:hypothetical protein
MHHLLNKTRCHSIGGILLSKFAMVFEIFLLWQRPLSLWIREMIVHRGFFAFFFVPDAISPLTSGCRTKEMHLSE